MNERANLYDVVVVGAGFAGLYALYRLRELGFRTRVLERSDGVGGTWYWNRYPGARCDVESLEYSYGFSDELQQRWHWTERYAAQPEILKYANHVADHFDLRRDIEFCQSVTAAHFDKTNNQWSIDTESGEVFQSTFCVMAIGCLSMPRRPDFEGLDSFRGDWYHTGYWPHEGVDFTDKRVGIIGTGSSAIQAIPLVAEQAQHLTVMQRTANFSIPARNAPLRTQTEQEWKSDYASRRHEAKHTSSGMLYVDSDKAAVALTAAEQLVELQARWDKGGLSMWNVFADILTDKHSNAVVAEFVRHQIRSVVKDPKVAETLCPKGYPIGSKRLCVDTGYYETFNRDNVTLVDLQNEPIEAITPAGLRTTRHDYHFDALIFATGFDAMTGPMLNMSIVGRNGESVQDKWRNGPRSYLGLSLAGFPNLFMITGPGSPSVLSNMMVSIEQHVDWIIDCLTYSRDLHCTSVEASPQAEDDWVAHCNEVADATLYPQANSWYMGANIPGKPRVFMPYVGGVSNYREKCDEIAKDGYRGFVFS